MSRRTVVLGIAYATLVASGLTKPFWVAGPRLPASLSGRSFVALTFDEGRGVVMLLGGRTAPSQFADDLWQYDGASWAFVGRTPAAMGVRAGRVMAYDSWVGRCVVVGGAGYSPGKDVWTWDGSTWSRGPAAPPPFSRRNGHAVAFDARRGVTVVFGGYVSSGGVVNDTWELSLTAGTWTRGPMSAEPWPRDSHDMAFDLARGVVVMHGGCPISSSYHFEDTWEYDGRAWSRRPDAPALMGDRWLHALAYDAARQAIVVYGGKNAPTQWLADTWELASNAWISPALSGGPGGRSGPSMAYDARRGRVVLVGGDNGSGSGVDDLTWEYVDTRNDVAAGQGHGVGNKSKVRVFDAQGQDTGIVFHAYGAGQWGVNVAGGAIQPGASDSIVTGPGPGPIYGPHVRAFLPDGTPISKVSFYAYGTLRSGANVGVAELDSDGLDDILTGPGPGVVFGPHVRAFEYDGTAVAALPDTSYFAYGTLRYGVNVGGAKLMVWSWAPREEILAAPGPGPSFSPTVRGWAREYGGVRSLFAFDAFPTAAYGAVVAGGDVDADASSDVLASPGPGPALPSQLRGFAWDGRVVTPIAGLDAVLFPTAYGARPGAGDVTGTLVAEITVGAGPDPSADATVQVLSFTQAALSPAIAPFTAFTSFYGVNASAAALGW